MMMKNLRPLRVIVVEDERLPRLSLLQKLADFGDEVEVVDSCEDYDNALHSILRLRPDVLLLDIQLQGHNSIELMEELRREMGGSALPRIIFTTAYSDRKYLMNAIKMQAVDYLLKPIDKKELGIALAKIAKATQPTPRGGKERTPAAERLTMRTASGKLFISPDKIAYLRADRNYSILYTFTSEEQIMESLAVMEKKLCEDGTFVRIDRSTIVNMDRVYKLNTQRRICQMTSVDGTAVVELELSKTALDTLIQLMDREEQ